MEVKRRPKPITFSASLAFLAALASGSRAGLESRRNELERLSLEVSFTPGREAATQLKEREKQAALSEKSS